MDQINVMMPKRGAMRRMVQSVIFILFALMIAVPGARAEKGAVPAILPVPDTVTLVDLGAGSCIPCKMMAPVLEEVEKEYQGRAAVVFIDVWQHPDQATEFKVSMIPTQIFFDRSGKEVHRHMGFMDKTAIGEQLTKLLAE